MKATRTGSLLLFATASFASRSTNMLIAHLPAGYLLGRGLAYRFQTQGYLWAALLGSVLPDFDMAYFYLFDGRQTLHHHYWTHIPSVWILAWAICLAVALAQRNRGLALLSTFLFSAVLLHLVLDTPTGGILWLHPLWEKSFILAMVPASHGHWVWNFVLHWTFWIEIVIAVSAAAILFRGRPRKNAAS